MKLTIAALITVACTTCAPPPREHVVLDPLTTDAAAVDEVHRSHKRAICVVRSETALQLCADKGFDGVTFDAADPGTDADGLRRRAAELGLPELGLPEVASSTAP